MEITSVKVRISEKEDNRMKGIVSVTIDNCFVIHDIRIIEGEKGLFVAMPSRKTATGEYRDIVHPTDSECRTMFNTVILDAYQKQLNS